MGSTHVDGYSRPYGPRIPKFMKWRIVSWIPRRVLLWCLVRAVAEYEIEEDWGGNVLGRIAYWRVLDYAVWKTFEKELTFKEWSESE